MYLYRTGQAIRGLLAASLNVGSAAANAQTRAYEQALERWKTSGYVRQGDAAILGVPAGTPTADVSYKNAALALQRWKNGYGG